MTPTALAQMIDELPQEDQEAAAEYIYLLHAKHHPSDSNSIDNQYRDYILAGIQEGEDAITQGKYYDIDEGRKQLLLLMK